jgi:hypothetical protein
MNSLFAVAIYLAGFVSGVLFTRWRVLTMIDRGKLAVSK